MRSRRERGTSGLAASVEARTPRSDTQVKALLRPRQDVWTTLFCLACTGVMCVYARDDLELAVTAGMMAYLMGLIAASWWVVKWRAARLARHGRIEQAAVLRTRGGRLSTFEVQTSVGRRWLYPGGIDGPEDGDSVLVFVLPHGRDVGAFVEKEGFAVDMGSRLRSILQFLLVAIAWAVLLGTLAASVTS